MIDEIEAILERIKPTVYIVIDRYIPIQSKNEDGILEDSIFMADYHGCNIVITHFAHAALIDSQMRKRCKVKWGLPS